MTSGLYLIKGNIEEDDLNIGLSNAKQLVVGGTHGFGTVIHIRATTPNDLKNAIHEFSKIEGVKEISVLAIENHE